MPHKILVFIPCYNCAPQIGRVLRQFEGVPEGVFSEILVVDNQSRDGTLVAAKDVLPMLTCAPVTLVRNDENYNLGGSHKAAFAYALAHDFTHVLVLHGDDQGDLRDILPQIKAGRHLECDALLGARFMQGSKLTGYSRFRIFGNLVFNGLFSLVSGRMIYDLGSGLNIFARNLFADPAIIRHADDLRFNIYLLLHAIDSGKRLVFFPISWREDDQISNVRLFRQARMTLAIAALYFFRRARFRHNDHRAVPRERYTFSVVEQYIPSSNCQNLENS